VALVQEALALVSDVKEIGRAAVLKAQLAQAYRFAGRLREALRANSAAMSRARHISKPDVQMMGFQPTPWIMSLRGSILVELGRFARARHWLDLVIAMTDLEPVVQFIPHYAYVRLAVFERTPDLAATHSSRVAWIAERSGIPYIQVYRLRCAGLSRLAAGDLEGAIAELTEGLKLCRRSGTARDNEAAFLAEIAEAHGLAGSHEMAVSTAKRALDLARRRRSRIAECHAHIVLATSLARVGHPGARSSLDAAEMLIRETGAAPYGRCLADVRAQIPSG
jgi:adenylate cyclase